MTWRVAQALLTLRGEIDAAAPNRSTRSDGTIGDAAHASRTSDHNPWVRHNGVGVVTAMDITHDPGGGVDCNRLADHLAALASQGDPRVKYIIWDRRIYNRSIADRWRPYTGSNPHTAHLHLSVSSTRSRYDSTARWGIHAEEELSMADVEKILTKLDHLDQHLHQLRRDVGRVDRELDGMRQDHRNADRGLREVRRNLRDVALAAGVDVADIEGDPHADDPRPEKG